MIDAASGRVLATLSIHSIPGSRERTGAPYSLRLWGAVAGAFFPTAVFAPWSSSALGLIGDLNAGRGRPARESRDAARDVA